jgi:hypothetical protein
MDNEQIEAAYSYDLCPECREEFIKWYNAVDGKLESTTNDGMIYAHIY